MRSLQVVLAAVVVSGVGLVLAPQYAQSILRLWVATAAGVVALHAFRRIVPMDSLWVSSGLTGREGQGQGQWKGPGPGVTPARSFGDTSGETASGDVTPSRPLSGREVTVGELARLRARMGNRRRRIPHAPKGFPPLPTEVVRLLQTLLRRTLEQEDLDPARSADVPRIRARLGTASRTILTCPPLAHAGWLRTRRPRERQVAEVVHTVLDDLARMGVGPASSPSDAP